MSFYRKAVLAAAVAPLLMLQPIQASAETIYGAMAKAYENNPDLNAARAGLRATDEGVTIAKAGYRPKVSATASASAIDVSGMNGGTSEFSYHQANAGFTITQTIFDGFQTLNSVRAAEAGVIAGRESLKANEISILLSAAQAYADIARDMQIVSIRQQNLKFLREQLNSANARLQVGEGTRTDVSQAEAQLASAEALLAAAQAQLAISQATYVQIVGDTPTGIKQPSPARKAMPGSVDQAVAIGVVEHPSVKAAFAQVDQADYNTKTAEGSLLPGVTLQGGVTRSITSSPSPSDNNNTAASITAQINIPIYQGGAEYGRVRQAKELAGQRRIMVDAVRASIRQQIVSAYAQLRAATASISANGKSVNAAQLALKGVIEERNVGQKTTLDVLNSQQTVLSAKENLVVAQHDAVVASYAVIAATGRLTVASQGLQVAEYRSEDHYEAVKDKWFGLRTVDTK